MKKSFSIIFQVAAVFIGTIVGAGLASGQEITQFFTSFGYKSIIGILLCAVIYISVSFIVINLSLQYKLNSYKALITTVNSGFLGHITDMLTTFFMVSGAAIILAGSGALIHQYFNYNIWIGISIMSIITLLILFRGTAGLIEINSVIVPILLIVITTIFLFYVFFSDNQLSILQLKEVPYVKHHWLLSSIVYASFNTISFSGVLVPLSQEIKTSKYIFLGVIIGALFLTLLCEMINFMLLNNIPYIYKYDIPLLYIVHRFGKPMQVILLIVIWFEMFSTEVSNIYSVSKTLETSLGLSYRKSVIITLALAIPISQIGFKNLINLLYPFFGVISFIFIIQCVIFYRQNS